MLLSILFISLITFLFYKRFQPEKKAFFIALFIKLGAGIGVGILYQFYYQHGDILNFLKDVQLLQTLSWKDYGQYLMNQKMPIGIIYDEFQPRALLFVKLLSVVNWIAQNNLWALSLWFSVINFILCWWTFSVVIQVYPSLKKIVYVCLFLNPSFVFWTSGLMKESLIVGIIFVCQAIFLGIIYQKLRKPMWIYGVFVLFALVLVWKIKYYFVAAFLGFFVPYLIVKMLVKNQKYQLMSYVGIVCFCLFFASFLHPNLQINNLLQAIVLNHDITVKSSFENGYIVFDNLEPTVFSFLKNVPKALWNGLFSPISFDFNFRLIETLLNLFCLGMLIFNVKKYFHQKWELEVFVCLFYTLFLAILLAFSSPNYGSLVRYKSIFLPILWLFALYPQRNFFNIQKENIRH